MEGVQKGLKDRTVRTKWPKAGWSFWEEGSQPPPDQLEVWGAL